MRCYSLEELSFIGSFLGGVFGTAIAFAALVYVRNTFRMQKKELKVQRKELKQTTEQIKRQQFESTFYNMLNMINTIGSQLSITIDHSSGLTRLAFIAARKDPPEKDIRVHTGNNFCLQFMEEMKAGYNIDNLKEKALVFLARKIHALYPDDKRFDPSKYDEGEIVQQAAGRMNLIQSLKNWLSECEDDAIFIGLLYEYYFGKFEYQLGHFFRYISNTIDFAIVNRDTNEERRFYINLIQAQLSNYQLAVMFYNALSPVSLNAQGEAKFRKAIDDYRLIKNLPKSMLIKPEHAKYYQTPLKNS